MSSEQTRRLFASLPFMDDLPKAVAQRFAEILIGSAERTTVVDGTQLFIEGEHEFDLDVLQFRWDKLNAAINAALKGPEQKLLRRALLDYARKHVLN